MLSLFLIGTKMDWDDGAIVSTLLSMTSLWPSDLLKLPTFYKLCSLHPLIPSKNILTLFSMLSMEFFPKNLVTAWLNTNFQQSNLESLLFETNAITILTFVSQNDLAKLLALHTFKRKWLHQMATYHV
jgi:hypothetical protein